MTIAVQKSRELPARRLANERVQRDLASAGNDSPFAGINNVTFAAGVEPRTRDVSHGELIRDGYDETLTVDPENLQMFFQKRDPESGGPYHGLPYRLGLLTLDTAAN
jgi:hypothetical protein